VLEVGPDRRLEVGDVSGVGPAPGATEKPG
jgi:hypothetical protein